MKKLHVNQGNSPNLLSPIEHALNRLLSSDENVSAEIFGLEGKTILLHIEGLDVETYIRFRHGRLLLSKDAPTSELDDSKVTVDVKLTGRINDFIALAKNQRDGESVSAGQVDIQGDLATAQRVQNLIRSMHLDVEEIIAKATNDAFAYRVGRIANKGFNLIRDGLRGLEQDVGSYLLYEKQLTPSQQELLSFSKDVDDVVLRLDRVESRLQQLKRQRTSFGQSEMDSAASSSTEKKLRAKPGDEEA